jgi:hypothetical protein
MKSRNQAGAGPIPPELETAIAAMLKPFGGIAALRATDRETSEEYLRPREAEQIFRVGRATLWRMAKAGRITCRRSGTAKSCASLFSRRELEAVFSSERRAAE